MLGMLLLLAVVAVASSGPKKAVTPPKGGDAPWPKLTGTIGPFTYTVSPQPPSGDSYAWELLSDTGIVGSSAAPSADAAIRAVMELGFEHAGARAAVTGMLGPYTFTIDQDAGGNWRGFATDAGAGGSVDQWIGKPATRGLGVLQALQWLLTRGAADWLKAPTQLAEPMQGAPQPPKPPLPGSEGWRHIGAWWVLVRPADDDGWIWAAFDPRDMDAARALDEADDLEGLGELARMAGEGPAGDGDGSATLADATLWAEQHSAEIVRRGLAFSPTCDSVRVVDMQAWIDWAAPQIRAALRAGTLTPAVAFVLVASSAPAKCPVTRLTLSGRSYAMALGAVEKAIARWQDGQWWNQTPVDEFIATALVGPPRVRVGNAVLYKQHLIVTRPSATGHRWLVYYGQRGFDDDPVLAGNEGASSDAQALKAAKAWVDQYGKFGVDLEGG